MLVYDITNEKSFDNIKNWIRNIEEVGMGKTGDTGEESHWVLTEGSLLLSPCHVAELRKVGCGQVRHFALRSAREGNISGTAGLTAPLA